MMNRIRRFLLLSSVIISVLAPVQAPAREILGSQTYRPLVLGRLGIVGAGRHFAAEAGLRMLVRGGNAVDAGVAATFAAAVTEISHFGMGGEVPVILYLAAGKKVLVINGQGTAPAAASPALFRESGGIPGNGPAAGTVPAVVDTLALALAEYGTLSLNEVLQPAIMLADGFPWYGFLSTILESQLEHIHKYSSGAAVYLQGPGKSIPPVGSIFRQPDLARTLRALAAAEQANLKQNDLSQQNAAEMRRTAIYAARDFFYQGEIGQKIARAVQQAGGLLSAEDLAAYRGRIEAPSQLRFSVGQDEYEVFKTGFWGQGPVLLQTLAILQGFDLKAMGHNSLDYIHTVTEALKLTLADRDAYYGDPDFSVIPATGLLSETYAAERRLLINPQQAHNQQRPGDPWSFQQQQAMPSTKPVSGHGVIAEYDASGLLSPDTTSVNIVDAAGNLFSASPSSAWFYGGVFIAGDTGIPLGNRMQAFVLSDDSPNQVRGGKRPRTTLSPTVVLRNKRPFLAISTPGGDSQDQQILQVLLNITVFGMGPQQAIEAPRFNTLQYHQSFGDHRIRPGVLLLENRIPEDISNMLEERGHGVKRLGPFMMPTAATLVGVDPLFGTLFGAADVRGQRFVVGW